MGEELARTSSPSSPLFAPLKSSQKYVMTLYGPISILQLLPMLFLLIDLICLLDGFVVEMDEDAGRDQNIEMLLCSNLSFLDLKAPPFLTTAGKHLAIHQGERL